MGISFPFTKQREKLHLGTTGLFNLGRVTVNLNTLSTHLYVVGTSGQGKSKFLQYILSQFATSKSWGCALIDPHADLANDLLSHLATTPRDTPWLANPANATRLIYLDPSRTDYLIPLNIFQSSVFTPVEIARNVVEAFRRVWPKTLEDAPRFSQILSSAVITLVSNGLSLCELQPVLTKKEFRDRLLPQVSHPAVSEFFRNEYDRWGKDQPIMNSSVLNKVFAFLLSPQMRMMLGANDNHLDLRDVMDNRKVLIVNLGTLKDEESKRLFGSLILTSLEQAALSRENIPESKRVPFFTVIDEFPIFASKDPTTFAQILSECRKYRLHLGIAHQSIGQLEERMRGALENAKLKVVFGTGRETAEAIAPELFNPNTKLIKHEVKDKVIKEKSHPVFAPLTEQYEDFIQSVQGLYNRQVYIKLPRRKKSLQKARVPKVARRVLGEDDLRLIRSHLAKCRGVSCKKLEAQISERRALYALDVPERSTEGKKKQGSPRGGKFWEKFE